MDTPGKNKKFLGRGTPLSFLGRGTSPSPPSAAKIGLSLSNFEMLAGMARMLSIDLGTDVSVMLSINESAVVRETAKEMRSSTLYLCIHSASSNKILLMTLIRVLPQFSPKIVGIVPSCTLAVLINLTRQAT